MKRDSRAALRRSHDFMGGQPAGKSRADRAPTTTPNGSGASTPIAMLLWGITGTKELLTFDEHPQSDQSLPPAAYDRMSYYEKWILALPSASSHVV